MKKWNLFGVIVVLASLLALTACERGQPPITAEQIVAKMKDAVATTKDAHVTVDLAIDAKAMGSQALNGQASVEVWYKSPANSRMEVKSSSITELKGALIVKNGQDVWAYLPSERTVYKGGFDFGIPMADKVLDALTGDLQTVIDAADVTRQPDEKVANKDAYRLKLVPKPPSAGQTSIPINAVAYLSVDQKTWLPLKLSVDAGVIGNGSVTVTALDLNAGVDDSVFQFTPPADAKVVDKLGAPAKPQTLTLDEAKATAGFKLLVPSYIPEGAVLGEVMRVQQAGFGEVIVLNYSAKSNGFSVVEGKNSSAFDLDKLAAAQIPNATKETVPVRGASGTLITGSGAMTGTFLTWVENGVRISIAGTIAKDEVLKVADSLK